MEKNLETLLREYRAQQDDYRALPYYYRGKEKDTGKWVYGYAVGSNKLLAGGEFVEIVPGTLGIKISSAYDDEMYTGDLFYINSRRKGQDLVVALYNCVKKAVCFYKISWSNVYETLFLEYVDTMEYTCYKQKLGKRVGNIYDNVNLIPDADSCCTK